MNIFIFSVLVCFSKFLDRHSENIYLPFQWWKWTILCRNYKRRNPLSPLPFTSISNQTWPSFVIGPKWTNTDSFVMNSSCDWQKMLGGPGWVRCTVRFLLLKQSHLFILPEAFKKLINLCKQLRQVRKQSRNFLPTKIRIWRPLEVKKANATSLWAEKKLFWTNLPLSQGEISCCSLMSDCTAINNSIKKWKVA